MLKSKNREHVVNNKGRKRNFQKESGYFNKIKNIDEIKELCKQKYNFILDQTKVLKNYLILRSFLLHL